MWVQTLMFAACLLAPPASWCIKQCEYCSLPVSDPGLGTEEGQPFNMSLEAEMMLEQLKEQHSRRVEDLQAQLESKVSLGWPCWFSLAST